MTWSGVVYVAFVIDAFSRRIVGWKADTTMKTDLVLDTLEMALWSRDPRRHPARRGHGLALRRRVAGRIQAVVATPDREELRWDGQRVG
jgi:putative transposase